MRKEQSLERTRKVGQRDAYDKYKSRDFELGKRNLERRAEYSQEENPSSQSTFRENRNQAKALKIEPRVNNKVKEERSIITPMYGGAYFPSQLHYQPFMGGMMSIQPAHSQIPFINPQYQSDFPLRSSNLDQNLKSSFPKIPKKNSRASSSSQSRKRSSSPQKTDALKSPHSKSQQLNSQFKAQCPQTPVSSDSSQAYSQLCQLISQSKDVVNYEEAIRKFENTEDAIKEKKILRSASMKGAKIDVRLFVGQVPRTWDDKKVMLYFKRFGQILEAKIIRDKGDNSHKGCAFIKCMNFHEAEFILKVHKSNKKQNRNKSKSGEGSRSKSAEKRRKRSLKNKQRRENAKKKKAALRLKEQSLQVNQVSEEGKAQQANQTTQINKIESESAKQKPIGTDSSLSDDESDNSFDEQKKYFDEESSEIFTRLQVRFADGELERLGIVNLEKTEQSKLYVCHINKQKQAADVNKVFGTFGEIEELFLFKDMEERFKGSCFIKYQTRSQALKVITKLNAKDNNDSHLKTHVDFVESGRCLDIRFADKKRKENIPISMIPPSLLNPGALTSSVVGNDPQNSGLEMMNQLMASGLNKNSKAPINPFMQSLQGGSAIPFMNAAGISQLGFNPMMSLGANQMAMSMSFLSMIPQKPGLRIYLESMNLEGKVFYYDVQKQLSSWEKPKRVDGEDIKIYTIQEVKELYQNYMNLMMSCGSLANNPLMPAQPSLMNPYLAQMGQMSAPSMIGMQGMAMDPSQFFGGQMPCLGSNKTHQSKGFSNLFSSNRKSKPDRFEHKNSSRDNSHSHNDNSYTGKSEGKQQSQSFQTFANGYNPQIGNISQSDFNNLSQEQQLQHQAIHGQYRQGPPGANLFIFHLPNEWGDLDLYLFFDQFKLGSIVSVRIMTDKENGRSKGYGFVSYDSPHGANQAIKIVNGKSALGKRLKVEMKKSGFHIPTHLINGGGAQSMASSISNQQNPQPLSIQPRTGQMANTFCQQQAKKSSATQFQKGQSFQNNQSGNMFQNFRERSQFSQYYHGQGLTQSDTQVPSQNLIGNQATAAQGDLKDSINDLNSIFFEGMDQQLDNPFYR